MATVLVVDDDAPSREFMCALLSHRGHQIREAPDGDSALTSVQRHCPDAVITDVLMPGLDGFQLARTLRRRPATKHLPIAFSTAHYSRPEIQPLAEACGVSDVIFKPAHPATALAAIDALLVPSLVSVPPADQLAETQRLTRSGTWEFDPATGTVVVSPQLRDLLRLRSARLALDEVIQRVHPDDLAAFTGTAENTWGTGSPGTVQLRVADTDGTVVELIVSCRTAREKRSGSGALWGVAQDVTSIREEIRTHLKVQTDWHAVRRTVDAFHRAVLPQTLPTVPGADLAAVYLPAPDRFDIGASWYDALPLPGGRVLMSVGKVAGHDLHPAAVMGHVLAVLRTYAHDDPDPVGVLARLNRYLTDTHRDDTFVTTVVALFDPDTGQLQVANGGHPASLLISPDHGGAVADLVAPAGPALGVLPGAEFAGQKLILAPGAALCAYTDGLIDRHNDPMSPARQDLPRIAAQAFSRLTGDHPDRLPAAHLLAESIVRDMLNGAAPDDDICLAVLRAVDDRA